MYRCMVPFTTTTTTSRRHCCLVRGCSALPPATTTVAPVFGSESDSLITASTRRRIVETRRSVEYTIFSRSRNGPIPLLSQSNHSHPTYLPVVSFVCVPMAHRHTKHSWMGMSHDTLCYLSTSISRCSPLSPTYVETRRRTWGKPPISVVHTVPCPAPFPCCAIWYRMP